MIVTEKMIDKAADAYMQVADGECYLCYSGLNAALAAILPDIVEQCALHILNPRNLKGRRSLQSAANAIRSLAPKLRHTAVDQYIKPPTEREFEEALRKL